jgi:hypothetical protein
MIDSLSNKSSFGSEATHIPLFLLFQFDEAILFNSVLTYLQLSSSGPCSLQKIQAGLSFHRNSSVMVNPGPQNSIQK